MTYSQVGRGGSRALAQGRMVDKMRTQPGNDPECGCPQRQPEIVLPGQGCAASIHLGKTAEATWVRCLECDPSATMRAASLSHIETRLPGCKLRSPCYLQ